MTFCFVLVFPRRQYRAVNFSSNRSEDLSLALFSASVQGSQARSWLEVKTSYLLTIMSGLTLEYPMEDPMELLIKAVLAELQQADLISREECEELQHINGMVRVQKGKSPEVLSKTAEVLRRHGFEEESSLLTVLGELQQADLITSEECKRLQVRYKWWRYDINDVIDVQRGKSPEVMSKTAEVLGRHGFEKESGLLAVLGELQQADLITREECKRLQVRHNLQHYDISDVVDVQSGKSHEVISTTAEVLRRHGFEKESTLLAVFAELHQADLISSEECEGLHHISDVVDVQKGKSPEEMSITAEVLRPYGFDEESRPLAEPRSRRSVSYKPPPPLPPLDWSILEKLMEQLRRAKESLPSHIVIPSAYIRLPLPFDEMEQQHRKVNAALAELQQAKLITSEECKRLSIHVPYVFDPYVHPYDVQKDKSPEVMCETAEVLRRHGFDEESRLVAEFLRHHDATELRYLVNEEWSRLSSAYQSLKKSVREIAKCLPKRSRHLFRQEYKSVSLSASQICRWPRASKVLDARDLRRQIEALHDLKLLQQLSSYEEDNLKPFIVNFLVQCQRKGVQPDSSLPDVRLSPSTPAGQVLGFILSRKDYYITDLHIDREHFSPWDVDTPPPARVPPILNGSDHRRSLDGLLTSHSALFVEVEKNLETLPQDRYQELRRFFHHLPHTGVHLPSSRRDLHDRLHRTPLFAPLCTALLRKVVWFLFTRDADNLSHKLEAYEKKLTTFVSQFLLACHVEGVVPPTGGMTLREDGCDLSDPAHLLACVLALKPYYVVSLHVDESLFTALEREGSLEGEEGREENVSMDASPLEPTPPTSECESPGSSDPPQSKWKGKHRVGTSSSAVPAKRSAQGEGRGWKREEEEEEAAGSSAKRRRWEESHRTGASQSGTGTGTDSRGSDVILSQMVYDHPDQLKLFRERVSRAAAGKGRAVLEGVGLKAAQITACFRAHPQDEEEGIQTGLIEWSGGQGYQPPTWAVLLKAMSYAKVEQEYSGGLKADLGRQ